MVDISLKGFGELAKPVTTLIHRVSEAVGVAYEPSGIVRRVRGEAYAEQEVPPNEEQTEDWLIQRAASRMREKAAREMRNIDAIVTGAAAAVAADATPESMDADWLTHFFEHAQSVSNEQMQPLWSRILAGEANRPGTVSRRTVQFASALSPTEAEFVTRFLGSVWHIGPVPWPIFEDLTTSYLESTGLTFEQLSHLEEIGLIATTTGPSRYTLTSAAETWAISYFGSRFHLASSSQSLDLGRVKLTKVGMELFPLSRAHGDPRHFHRGLAYFDEKGYEVKRA